MKIKGHDILLRWSIYLAGVLFLWIFSVKLGIIQLGFKYDVTYLGTAILLIYAMAEMALGFQHWKIDRNVTNSRRLLPYLRGGTIRDDARGISVVRGRRSMTASDPQMARVLRTIQMNGQRPDELQILDRLHESHGFGRLAGEMIVALGIFGTVCGVILTLIPFLGVNKFDIAQLQPELLRMFTGMAVAFFPTALSILLKVLLDMNDYLMGIGLRQWSDVIMTNADVALGRSDG